MSDPPARRPPLGIFTPFLRRFTDERARDLEETQALYRRVEALHDASDYTHDEAVMRLALGVASQEWVKPELTGDFYAITRDILTLEKPIFTFPRNLNLSTLTLKQSVDLRRFLRSKEYFHAHEDAVIGLLLEFLLDILRVVAEQMPQTLAPSPFTIPLIYTVAKPKELIEFIFGVLWDERYEDASVFVELRNRVLTNLYVASGIVDREKKRTKPFTLPTKYDGTLEEIVRTYLGGTPFLSFFLTPVPLKFTYDERFSHMHVIGGSGAGKTTILQNLILDDLRSESSPSLVIIDSQGDLIDKLSHLALFNDRELVLITPKDIDHPPALNIFDVNRSRLGNYDQLAKEQVVAGVIQTFDYLFAGLLGADLTAKQGVFFRFVARLMLALPETMGRNATILDMIGLMDDPEPYRRAIESLPDIPRQFFERDFPSKTFAQTKEQIRYRLHAILENPTLARLFTSPQTKIDLFDELNRGSIILVDTAKDFLKGASSHFGRIFISLVLQAVLERAVIPEAQRKPAFLIVDEAASYFDSNIDDLLTEARKYKLGCVFAHQFLDQCAPALRASLAANTSIKFAGGVSMADARAMAQEMRTTPDFIVSQPRLHFAAYIRNVTPQAVSIPVPVGLLESQPRLSREAYEKLKERNRERVSLPRGPAAKEAPPPPPRSDPDQADTNPSSDWG